MAMSTDDECWSRSSNVAISPKEENGAEIIMFVDRRQEERSGDERRGDKF
jgi:hypothetical protein